MDADTSPTRESRSLDRRLQQSVRLTTTRDRDVERVGPFVATFDHHSDHPYLSYAIPDDDAQPSDADVAALAAAFRARGRVARLEFFPAAAPAAEAALRAGGFAVEARLAVMTCGPEDVLALPAPAGIALAVPATDDDVRGLRRAQHAAFGMPDAEVDDDEVARTWAALESGGLAVLARDEAGGAIVGGGVTTVPAGGVSEVAGIGVVERHRRRGIAGAVTAALARDALAAGQALVWLTPGDDGAHRVYARAGFADRTEMLHLVLAAG